MSVLWELGLKWCCLLGGGSGSAGLVGSHSSEGSVQLHWNGGVIGCSIWAIGTEMSFWI